MRLGILGGTFDPPHIGHLIAAQDAWSALELDRVVFVPAGRPPHKPGRAISPAAVRLAMLRVATAGDARFEVSDLELRRSGPSYSVDTLRELRERYPGVALFFLVGADQLREMHSWRAPEEIARLATVVMLARGGVRRAEPAVAVPYTVLPVTRVDVSATEIRRRVAAGESIRYLVPLEVVTLIEQNGLYRPAAGR
ncbi:MAG: nicotinate-nucleotide adenylyltransferase [Gemmatimonadetes bacterium]|nr:nicotinate-nucleotide adenylyltransferase [Gemmatimonadota bacterium]